MVTTTPPETNWIEVFLAPQECTEPDAQNVPQPCAMRLAWSATSGQRDGTLFDLDFQTGDGEAVTTAEVTGSSTVIALEADQPKRLARVVIVGYAGDPITEPASANAVAVLHDVEVPAGRGETWDVELEPVSMIPDAPSAATSTRVRVWRRPGGTPEAPTAACVAIQKPGDVPYEFLVPHDDPDCDAKVPECRPFIGNFVTNSLERTCATFDTTHTPPACVLGNRACTDGVPRALGCTQLTDQYCVPDAFCTCVDPFDGECLRTALDPTTYAGPRFSCTLAFDGTVLGGTTNVCPNDSLDTPRLGLSTALPSTQCTGLELGVVGVPVGFSPNPMLNIEPGLSWTITRLTGCEFEIRLMGLHDPMDLGTHTVLAAFALDANRHLVVPVQVTWKSVDGCSAANPSAYGCFPLAFDQDLGPFTCVQ